MMMLPQMLRAILFDSIGTEPDIELIDLGDGLNPAKQRNKLDAMLVPCDSNCLRSVWAMLVEQPNLAVLALNRNASLAHLFRIHRQTFDDPSADTLLLILRSLANHCTIEPIGDRS
jgi:hypothetical protein